MADRRFPTSFKDVPDADEPGLVLGDDNVVYLIKPDGSRVEVGGGGASPSLPIADPAGVAIDTTTYDNPITGVGKLATLVFPQDTAALAIAIAGDAFPRWLFSAAPQSFGILMGDGTSDPTSGDITVTEVGPGPKNSDGSYSLFLDSSSYPIQVGLIDENAGPYSRNARGFGIGQNQVIIQADVGAPTVGGNEGDLYINRSGGALTTIYRCTTPGTAGDAVWTGII